MLKASFWSISQRREGSPGGSVVKECKRGKLQSWIRKIPWEKEMTTHSNILAWKIPWTEDPGGATVHGFTRVGHNLVTKPLPISCKIINYCNKILTWWSQDVKHFHHHEDSSSCAFPNSHLFHPSLSTPRNCKSTLHLYNFFMSRMLYRASLGA